MNHVYRTLWNAVTRSFVAVAENANSLGKRSSGSKARSRAADEAVTAAGPRSRRALVSSPPSLLRLEPRLVFDGAAVDTALHAVADSQSIVAEVAPVEQEISKSAPIKNDADFVPAAVAGAPAATTQRTEIVFIENNVVNYETMLNSVNPGAEVHVLDGTRDGLAQMAEFLAGRSGIDAIHIFSHGEKGALCALVRDGSLHELLPCQT